MDSNSRSLPVDTGPRPVVHPRAGGGHQPEHLQVDGVHRGAHLQVVDGGRRVALLREDLQADLLQVARLQRDLRVAAAHREVGDLREDLRRAGGGLPEHHQAALLQADLPVAQAVEHRAVGDLRVGRRREAGDLRAAHLQADLRVGALPVGGDLQAVPRQADGVLQADLRAAHLQDGAALPRAATGPLRLATAVRQGQGIRAEAIHRAPAVIRALQAVAARATPSRPATP